MSFHGYGPSVLENNDAAVEDDFAVGESVQFLNQCAFVCVGLKNQFDIDFFGCVVVDGGYPDWLSPSSNVGYEKDESAGEEIITKSVMTEGDYAFIVSEWGAFTDWLCGPLEVVEAPSE